MCGYVCTGFVGALPLGHVSTNLRRTHIHREQRNASATVLRDSRLLQQCHVTGGHKVLACSFRG